jgi:hypothetical protein
MTPLTLHQQLDHDHSRTQKSLSQYALARDVYDRFLNLKRGLDEGLAIKVDLVQYDREISEFKN